MGECWLISSSWMAPQPFFYAPPPPPPKKKKRVHHEHKSRFGILKTFSIDSLSWDSEGWVNTSVNQVCMRRPEPSWEYIRNTHTRTHARTRTLGHAYPITGNSTMWKVKRLLYQWKGEVNPAVCRRLNFSGTPRRWEFYVMQQMVIMKAHTLYLKNRNLERRIREQAELRREVTSVF